MSDSSTKRMLDAYMEEAQPPGFLAGLFQTPPRNFHNSEKVEIDIIRNDPHIAVPLPGVTSGARSVEASKYVNKSFLPPVYDMETAISAYDALKRRPGEDPFQDPDFLRSAVRESFSHMRGLENMIRRGIELQAAQVLQTGVLDIRDSSGASIFALDFEPKATHFATAAATWATDGSTGDPMADLTALAEIVRRDGKREPDQLIFGSSAIQRFLANAKVQALLDKRLFEPGMIRPEMRGGGATYHGKIWINNYEYQIWSYKETYIDPQTGNHTPYLNTEKVIMRASAGRLDLTFGAIPMFVPPEARAAQFLPPRMSSPERGLDFTTNVWVTPDGKRLMLSVGTRALCVPTAIDTFGCLDVTV